MFAFGAIAFYGLMLGGWASGSKYSFLGAMRAAAQLISYEVVAGPGARRRGDDRRHAVADRDRRGAGRACGTSCPQFVGFLVFMVAGFAETNRAPFDLVEADAELVGGYNTEYGGARFASYYFAEYLNVIVVSGIAATMFLGGWLLPFGIDPPGWVDPFVVLVKMFALRLLLHLDPRDAAAPALRPADDASAGRSCCRSRRSTRS